MGNYFDTNYNARITSKTSNRVAVTEKVGNKELNLSGAQARTLYRVLTKHFGQTGKSFDPVKVQVTG